jgi:hypothetical protein
MVTLVLVVCLAATPDICREEQPPAEIANAESCIVEGQVIASRWLEEHPKWTLKAWRCRIGNPERAG